MKKFSDPQTTADGKPRAFIHLQSLKTLWFNTGTVCNLMCRHCYIESSPRNDRLKFLEVDDIRPFLEEIETLHWNTKTIGLTGGEPFVNPHITALLTEILSRGFEVLILTNAYRTINRYKSVLQDLRETYPRKLYLRVSLDHWSKAYHEKERGPNTFEQTLMVLKWLFEHKFQISLAGRSFLKESKQEAQQQYTKLLSKYGIDFNLQNDKLIIFPEMDRGREVPEITVECWEALKVRPEAQMCASERMVIKRKGESSAKVVPCTLLAYDTSFELGTTLLESHRKVYLNHPFCAQFCVLGGASCSSVK